MATRNIGIILLLLVEGSFLKGSDVSWDEVGPTRQATSL